MTFMRIEGDEQVDADRAALSSFLEARGLRIARGRTADRSSTDEPIRSHSTAGPPTCTWTRSITTAR